MIGAYSGLFALTAFWGLTFPVVQLALRDASPTVFLAVRFAIASLAFPLLVWPRAFRLNRELLWKGLWLGILLWAGFALQTFGLGLTSAARSGFITGMFVPLTPMFAWLLFRQKISTRIWLAVLLATAGVMILSRPETGGLNLGDLLTLGCAISFALQVVFVGRWVNPANEVQLTWLQLVVTGILAVMCLPFEAPRLHWTPSLISALAYTALIGSALAIWGQMRFQPRMSAAAAAVIFAFEPVFAGIAAWLMLDAVIPPSTLIAAAFIVSGMLLTAAAANKKILTP